MKRMKMNLAIFAVMIGATAAYANAPKKPAATLYGYNQSTGLWVLTRAGSHCNTDPSVNCEAQFNGDPNNGGTMVQGTLIKGDFIY